MTFTFSGKICLIEAKVFEVIQRLHRKYHIIYRNTLKETLAKFILIQLKRIKVQEYKTYVITESIVLKASHFNQGKYSN